MTTPPAAQPLSMVRAAALGRPDPVRSWTPVGTVDAAAIADVDPAGWVQPRGVEWSLDWWVGAEDRWHQPAQEAAVRQRCLHDAPIVETAMRVPGGDVVHRVVGVRAASTSPDGDSWDDSAVLVEIENATSVPVALALVVRPLTLTGSGRVGSVEVDGPVVKVDGRVAAVLSRPAARIAHGAVGQVAGELAAGRDAAPGSPIAAVAGDRLEAAVVVPLPHTAVVRVLMPRVVPQRRRLLRGAVTAAEPGADVTAPDVDALASGWAAHTREIARVELGEPLLDRLVLAAASSMVVGSTDAVLDRGERAVQVAELLARCGLTEPLGPLARALVDRQKLGGAIRLGDGADATAALLFSAAPLLATGSELWEEALLGPVAKSVHLIRKGGAPADPAAARSTAAALALVAPSLRVIGQPEVAEDAEAAARSLLEASVGAAATATSSDPLIDQLVATRDAIALGDSSAVAALVDLARLGDAGAVCDRVDAQGVPCGDLGYDPGAVAARANAVLDLALIDGVDGPVLMPAWPAAWWGRNIEVHGVVTRWGRASFAMRWHGTRPAVLWELEPGDGVDAGAAPPVWTCPGLDPSWRGHGWSGEGLLAEVTPPDGLVDAAEPEPVSLPLTPTRIDLPAPPAEGQSFS